MLSVKSVLVSLAVCSSVVILLGNAVWEDKAFGESVGLQMLRSLT